MRVAVDNKGTVTSVQAATRPVQRLTSRGETTAPEPVPPGRERAAGPAADDAETLLAQRFSRRLYELRARRAAGVVRAGSRHP